MIALVRTVASRARDRVDRGPRLLATVMALPLVDGLFPTLVVAGALSTPVGVLEVGLLVFGGAATVAIVLADLDGPLRTRLRTVLAIGTGITLLAGLEAALAPALASVLDLATFERFAAVVVAVVAARTASATIADLLPGPATVVALGALASVDPTGARLTVTTELRTVAAAAGAGAVATAFAAVVAACGPRLRRVVDVDRFRVGSALALGVLAIQIPGWLPTAAPLALAVLVIAAVLAVDLEPQPTNRPGDPAPAVGDGNLAAGGHVGFDVTPEADCDVKAGGSADGHERERHAGDIAADDESDAAPSGAYLREVRPRRRS